MPSKQLARKPADQVAADFALTEGRMKPPAKVQPSKEYVRRVSTDIQTIGAFGTLLKRWRLQEAESIWAQDAANPRRSGVFAPGDEVVFTAKFLQQTNAARDIPAVFTIQDCSCELCALGLHVSTSEWMPEWQMFRHVHRDVIRHRGLLCSDEGDGLSSRHKLPDWMMSEQYAPRVLKRGGAS